MLGRGHSLRVAGGTATTGSASPAPLFVPRPPGKKPSPPLLAVQSFPALSLLAPSGLPARFSCKVRQAGGKPAPCPPIDRVENFPAGGIVRGKKALLAAVACQFSPAVPESGVAAPWGCCTFKLRA